MFYSRRHVILHQWLHPADLISISIFIGSEQNTSILEGLWAQYRQIRHLEFS